MTGDRTMTAEGYSSQDAARLVGITFRQLDYWDRTDLVSPSLAEARGSGSRRRYSEQDLLELAVVRTLLDAGLRLESVRVGFGRLAAALESGEDIGDACLVLAGSHAYLAADAPALYEAVARTRGAGVVNLLRIADVRAELHAAIELSECASCALEAGRPW